MTKKLSNILGLFAFFAVLFAFAGRQGPDVPQYRDAPADFGGISADDIRGQEVAMPAAVEAVDNRGGQPQLQPVAIYGDNTLADYYKVSVPLQQLADSVVAIVKKSSLAFDENTRRYAPLKVTLVGESRNFAPTADFYDQRVLAFCSGSLVGGSLVLTAGHCISSDRSNSSYFKDVYVVFGWRQSGAGQYEASFTEDQVYEVDRIVVHKLANGLIGDMDRYQDYSLLQLDRAVRGRAPLALDRTGDFLVAGNKVFLAGYPIGMSVKITDPDDATIQEIGRNIYSTDLDAFGGNSGGPVFDSYTRRITGVVVTANAKQFKYTLNSGFAARLAIDEGRNDRLAARSDERGAALTVSRNILAGFTAEVAKKGITVDEANKSITFPAGLVYYNNEFLAGVVNGLGGGRSASGEPVRLPAYEGIGTGVQRIDALIEALTPLTPAERGFCDSLGARMRASMPVIDPSLMMLYRKSKCNKGQMI